MQVLKVTLIVDMGLTFESDRRRGYLFPGPAVMLPFLLSHVSLIILLPMAFKDRGSSTLMYNLMIEIQ